MLIQFQDLDRSLQHSISLSMPESTNFWSQIDEQFKEKTGEMLRCFCLLFWLYWKRTSCIWNTWSDVKLPPQGSFLHHHCVSTGVTPRSERPWLPPASSGSRPTGWTAWTAGTSVNQRSGISGWSSVLAAVYVIKRSLRHQTTWAAV